MTPEHFRLQEAVSAMRDIQDITAAAWERRYPDFVKAINESPFIPANRDKWTARVETMRTELDLRTAEYLLTLGRKS
jgi:hypothetical protein